MWSGIGRWGYAVIKANKIVKQPLSLQQIDACRELLGIRNEEIKSTLVQAARKYMHDRSNYSASINASTALKKWGELRPLDYEVDILALSQTYGETQSRYITQVVKHWGTLLLNHREKAKADRSQLQTYRTVLRDYFTSLNSLIYLVQLDQHLLVLYLKIYHIVQGQQHSENKSYSQLRFVFDCLLRGSRLSDHNLEYVIFFTSKYTPHIVYHTRETELMDMLFGRLPTDWSTNPRHVRLMKNVLFALAIHPYCPAIVIDELPKIFVNATTTLIRFRAFCAMMQLFLVSSSTVVEPSTVQVIQKFMEQIPEQVFPKLSKLFYRADIWLQVFWLGYFRFAGEGTNHKLSSIYHHHVIDDLLQSSRGGERLKTAALTFRTTLKQKGMDIKNVDIRKEYMLNFGRVIEGKSSLQLHVANSMRLVCGAEVITQSLIKYFLVDILVGKQLIVQLNNSIHYKRVQGNMVLNLKSRFRERVLTQMGYLYKNIAIDDYTSSNYKMLQEINAIVEESKRRV